MGAHIKTTIDVSDALFDSARTLAKLRQTTMRALIEEGLRRVLSDAKTPRKPAFKLPDASVRGKKVWIADPRRWHQMEEEHVAARTLKSNR